MKLKVPNCLQSRVSHHTLTWKEEKGTDTAEPCGWQGLRGHGLSPVSLAHILWAMCFFLPAFGFLQVCSEYLLELTVPCFQEPKALGTEWNTVQWTSKATLLRGFHKQPGHQGACWGLGWDYFVLVFFFKFQQERCAMFHMIQIWHHSLKCCIAISITLKWEKCKVVFPFYLESLRSVLVFVL